MLRWLGEEVAAERLIRCVEKVTERGVKARDLGGECGTEEVTLEVCAEIETVLRAHDISSQASKAP
jgi:isocitrate/isopropylmalate dehydrogenase